MSTLKRLGEKWDIDSPRRIIIILIVFTLTGSTVVYAKKWVFALFGFDAETTLWIKVPVYILTIFPMYQLFLMVYGTLLGEFKFFWAKEKKLLQFFARPFRKKESKLPSSEQDPLEG